MSKTQTSADVKEALGHKALISLQNPLSYMNHANIHGKPQRDPARGFQKLFLLFALGATGSSLAKNQAAIDFFLLQRRSK